MTQSKNNQNIQTAIEQIDAHKEKFDDLLAEWITTYDPDLTPLAIRGELWGLPPYLQTGLILMASFVVYDAASQTSANMADFPAVLDRVAFGTESHGPEYRQGMAAMSALVEAIHEEDDDSTDLTSPLLTELLSSKGLYAITDLISLCVITIRALTEFKALFVEGDSSAN